MSATPIEMILAQAPIQPEELTLPGWKPGAEITVRVRRPSLYAMLAANAALNPLIPELNKLFVAHDRSSVKNPSNAYAKALIAIAKECLVEPTYESLAEAGIQLTDDQLTDLMLYATEGVEWLCTFRARLRARIGKHGRAVQNPAQPDSANLRSPDGMGAGRGDRSGDAAAAQRGQAAPQKNGK